MGLKAKRDAKSAKDLSKAKSSGRKLAKVDSTPDKKSNPLSKFMEEFRRRMDGMEEKLETQTDKIDSIGTRIDRIESNAKKQEKNTQKEFTNIRNEIRNNYDSLQKTVTKNIKEDLVPKIEGLEIKMKTDIGNIVEDKVLEVLKKNNILPPKQTSDPQTAPQEHISSGPDDDSRNKYWCK